MLRLRLIAGVALTGGFVSIAGASAQPPPATPPDRSPVRVGGAIRQPQKTKDVKPIYPPDAQSARVQGVVIVEATIDPAGKVSEAKILRSIPLLDDAAVSAVKQWEFTPTLVDGVARPVIMTVTVNFMLGANTPPPDPTLGRLSTVVLMAAAGQNGARYVFEITPERSEKLPHWDQAATGEPPLSMGEARTLAMSWIKSKAPQADGFELAASSFVRARTPAAPAGSPGLPAVWFYSIGFDRIVGNRRIPGGIESVVVVLLDRSIVEPRVESTAAPAADGVYRPGDGITLPRPIAQPQPSYTSAAMKAKIQGVVLLEAVVKPDGTVGDVKVVRSLDSTLGLDEEAIKTAKRWRFEPGRRLGTPVPVLITIELTFKIR